MPDVALPEKRKVDSSILSLTTSFGQVSSALTSANADWALSYLRPSTDHDCPCVTVVSRSLSHADRTAWHIPSRHATCERSALRVVLATGPGLAPGKRGLGCPQAGPRRAVHTVHGGQARADASSPAASDGSDPSCEPLDDAYLFPLEAAR